MGRVVLPVLTLCLNASVWVAELLPVGGDVQGCVVSTPDGRDGAPVVRNTTTMTLKHPQRGDTGWWLELEVAFSRDPPLYGEGDESIEVECSVIEYWGKGAGEQSNPPLPIGHTIVMNAYVNNVHGLRSELMPLQFDRDGTSRLIAFHRFNVGTQAFSVGGKRCHGAVVD